MSDIHTTVDIAATPHNISPPSAPLLQAKFQKRLQSHGNEFLLDVTIDATPGFTILFGALAMQQWGIRPVPDQEKLDLSHYSKEFVEF